MTTIQIKRLINSEAGTMQLQQNVIDAFNGLIVQNPILYGVLLKDIALAHPGTTTVEHKLNREIQGYIVVKQNADANIWLAATQTLPTKFITFQTDLAVTVSLWVF